MSFSCTGNGYMEWNLLQSKTCFFQCVAGRKKVEERALDFMHSALHFSSSSRSKSISHNRRQPRKTRNTSRWEFRRSKKKDERRFFVVTYRCKQQARTPRHHLDSRQHETFIRHSSSSGSIIRLINCWMKHKKKNFFVSTLRIVSLLPETLDCLLTADVFVVFFFWFRFRRFVVPLFIMLETQILELSNEVV